MKQSFGATTLCCCGAAILTAITLTGCSTAADPKEAPAKAAEAAKAEPVKPEAPKTEVTKTEAPKAAVKVETPKAEPVKKDAVKQDAVKAEPAQAAPAKPEAVKAEPVKQDAPQAAPANTEAPKTEAPQAEAPKVDPFLALPEVITEGNGIKVTREDLRTALQRMVPGGQFPELPPEQMQQLAAGQGRMLAFMQALSLEIKKSKFAPTDAEIAAFVKEMLHKQPQLEQALAAQGKTADVVTQEVLTNPEAKKNIVEQMFVEKAVVIKNATEADAKKYYDANLDKFTVPADGEKTLRASHILIMVDAKADDATKKAAEAKANDVLAKVKADPASFEKLAAEVSDCPSGKQSGGDLGPFEPERMVPEFSKATAALKPGEISGLVKTQFGYHIIRRNAPQGEKVIPFDDVKARIVDALTQRAGQEAFMAYMKKIETEYAIKSLIPEAPKPEKAK